MTRLEKQVIEAVLRSLETEPDKWRYHFFTVKHVDGFASVWIGNGLRSLEITFDNASGLTVGGVTLASSLFGPLIPWRRRLYRAAIRFRPSPPRPMEEVREAKLAHTLQLLNNPQKDKP